MVHKKEKRKRLQMFPVAKAKKQHQPKPKQIVKASNKHSAQAHNVTTSKANCPTKNIQQHGKLAKQAWQARKTKAMQQASASKTSMAG